MDSLEHETVIAGSEASTEGGTSPEAAPSPALQPFREDALDDSVFAPEVQRVIRAAMEGTLPLSGPLRTGQTSRLSPRHVQMILMRVAGFQVKEVAEAFGVTPTCVSLVTHHPHARTIASAVLTRRGPEVIDIRSRYEQMSEKAIRRLEGILDDPAAAHKDVRAVAFGILDRAGYGEVQQSKVEHSVTITDEAAKHLGSVLKESAQEVSGSWAVVTRGNEGGGREVSQASLPAREVEPPHLGPQALPPAKEAVA